MVTILEMAKKKPETVPVSVRLLKSLHLKLIAKSEASDGLLSVSYFVNQAVDLYVNGPKQPPKPKK